MHTPLGSGRTLRIGVIGVRAQEARRYYVSLQILSGSNLPSGVAGSVDNGMWARPDQVVRTETSEVSRNPDFAASSFVLRLPQPVAATPLDAPLLRLDLFAAPALEPPGPASVTGPEMDELVCSGVVLCGGDLAARLLRGERVALSVALGPPGDASASAAAAGSGPGLRSSSVMLPPLATATSIGLRSGATRSREVLLELMLLDAQLALPSDAFAARAKAVRSGSGLALPGSPSARSPASGRKDCTLLVLVSRAENLPLVLGDGGVEAEPDTFVAAKSLRDAAGSRAAQALTRVVTGSCRPCWQQVLRMRYPEAGLQSEQLLLAIVNNANNRLMIKAALPLAPLIPDKHYNLRLSLPGGPLGSAVYLYVTLVLTDCTTVQQRYLRNCTAAAKQLLQARLVSASGPLNSTGSPAGEAAGAAGGGQVFAAWRVACEAAAADAPALPDPDPYTTLDTSREDAVAAALHAMADRHAAAVKAGADAGGSLTEVLPLEAEGGEQRLWPRDHMVSLLSAASSGPAALQVALYHVPPAPSARPPSASPAPAANPALSREERLLGRPPGASAAAPPGPSAAEGGAAGTSEAGARPAPRLLSWASVPLQPRPAAAGGLGPGQVQLLEGVVLRPGPGLATAAAPGGEAASAGPGGGSELTACLEVRQRDTAAVVSALESEASQPPSEEEPSGELVASPSADAKPRVAWQTQDSAADPGHPGLRPGSGGASGAGALVEALVETCILSQGALGRLIRQVDAAAAQQEVAAWRVADAENRCRSAMEDNNKLRQLLHEEKQACRSPPLLPDSSSLNRDELIIRCEAAMAAYGRERRRNAELVHRLQQLHAEQVDTLELKQRYQQLQEAHMEQARAYAEIDQRGRRNGQLQATVKTQEDIIRNLEALLAQAVEAAKSEGAAKSSLREEHERLLQEALQLQEHCQVQDALVHELESQLAAAQHQLAKQKKELKMLRQHTTTEYRADGSTSEPTRGGGGAGEGAASGAAEPGPDYQRMKQLEEKLAAARTRNKELDAAVAAKQAAEDNLKRLEGDVGKLVEEKTAALLRAEYAEGAATAAQDELMEVTRKFARDIAELKTRLAEKDAMLMGGFGDLDQLRRGELPHPAEAGAFDLARLGTPPGMGPLLPSGMPPGHAQPTSQLPHPLQGQPAQRRASGSASAGGQRLGPGNGGPGLGHGAGLVPSNAPGLRVRSAEGHERGSRGGTPPDGGAGMSPAAAARPSSQGAASSPSPPPPPLLLPPIHGPNGGGPESSSPSPPAESAPPPARAKPARTRLGRRPPSPPKDPPAEPEPPPPPPLQQPAEPEEGGHGRDDGSPLPQGADDGQGAPEGAAGRRAPRVLRRRK